MRTAACHSSSPRGNKSCDRPQWSPDGEWIAFLSKRLGKKNIWLIRVQGGEARQLTDVKDGVGSFKWSPDGQSIAFTALDPLTSEEEKATKEKNDARVVDENIKMSRLYVVSSRPTNGPPAEARLLTKGNYSVGRGGRTGRAFDWSPDGKTIVFSRTSTPRPDDWPSADLLLVDVAREPSSRWCRPGRRDFASLFARRPVDRLRGQRRSADLGRQRRHSRHARRRRRAKTLADTCDGFGRYSELVGWSADGRKLYYTEARGTTLQVGALPLDGKPQEISQADGMMVGGVHLNHSRTKFGFAWEDLTDQPRPSSARWSASSQSRSAGSTRRLPCRRWAAPRSSAGNRRMAWRSKAC